MIVQYCAMCIAEMLHNTKHRDSSVNIPLSPDQHHCSDEAKWRIGGLGMCYNVKQSVPVIDGNVLQQPLLQHWSLSHTTKYYSYYY